MNVIVETPSYDGVIAEGCQPAKITFKFNSPVKEDINLNLRLLNDLTLGSLASSSVDFNSIPSQGIIKKVKPGLVSACMHMKIIFLKMKRPLLLNIRKICVIWILSF